MGIQNSKSKLTSNKMPDPVIVSASAKHTASFIFLHGLGDTGINFRKTRKHQFNTFLYLNKTISHSIYQVICPSAGKMPVTLNSGFESPSWFDLLTLDANGPEDEAGIKKAAQIVISLIQDEIKAGIPAERIMIGKYKGMMHSSCDAEMQDLKEFIASSLP
ncbi:acyl-protein thioesterase 2-like [Eurytemora carolleeae]|uniref:acyl-protein thioesterase 2-like n=1 Tax=Eurytemora carolleeae TaxID=1294199 RepID=UPI000C75C046|nr:acyl-protein thioesterase 2-like [Eurytemora carolleeae]|eukprot:XP_023334686.1 acyl-protein thioesterase 2-like [Eurytemora affinis]